MKTIQEKHEEFIQQSFENLVERHLDIKNYLQMCQDFDIIRKIVFKQRHLVLRPFITLEYEKRALIMEEEEGEGNKDVIKNEQVSHNKVVPYKKTSKTPTHTIGVDDND